MRILTNLVGDELRLLRSVAAPAGDVVLPPHAAGQLAVQMQSGPDVVVVDLSDGRAPGNAPDVLLLKQIRRSARAVTCIALLDFLSGDLLRYLAAEAHPGLTVVDRGVLRRPARLRSILAGARGGVLKVDVVLAMATAKPVDGLQSLTRREAQVLDLMALGLSNLAIARSLYLSMKTIETHIGNIYRKLALVESDEVHRRSRAIGMYLSSSLVS